MIGEMSEISWIQRVRDYSMGACQEAHQASQAAVSQYSLFARDLNYFMDESDLLSINEDYVEAWRVPSPEMRYCYLRHAFIACTKRSAS